MARFAACLVVAACLVAALDAAPINGDALLSNIEKAAEATVQQDDAKAKQAEAQADQDEAQLKSNKAFATQMAAEIRGDTEMLEAMKKAEKKSVEDAQAIESDVSSSDVQDIEAKDTDAEKKSAEVQAEAEETDKQMLAQIKEMRGAHIEGTKVAAVEEEELGEEEEDFPGDDTGSYKERLAAVEADAHQMVDAAEKKEASEESRKQAAESQLSQMSEMAKTGLAQLKKSEAQLHQDLAGHKDSDLEADIEAKAQDIKQGVDQSEETGDNQNTDEDDDDNDEEALGEEARSPSPPAETPAPQGTPIPPGCDPKTDSDCGAQEADDVEDDPTQEQTTTTTDPEATPSNGERALGEDVSVKAQDAEKDIEAMPAPGKCARNDQCDFGQTCVSGSCSEMAGFAVGEAALDADENMGSCKTDSDCKLMNMYEHDITTCLNGVCVSDEEQAKMKKEMQRQSTAGKNHRGADPNMHAYADDADEFGKEEPMLGEAEEEAKYGAQSDEVLAKEWPGLFDKDEDEVFDDKEAREDVLGEEGPLEDAEQAAEAAASDEDSAAASDDAENQNASMEDAMKAAEAAADNEDDVQATSASSDTLDAAPTADKSSELNAIEKDAEQLEAYQKNSINEIKQIEQPLAEEEEEVEDDEDDEDEEEDDEDEEEDDEDEE